MTEGGAKGNFTIFPIIEVFGGERRVSKVLGTKPYRMVSHFEGIFIKL